MFLIEQFLFIYLFYTRTYISCTRYISLNFMSENNLTVFPCFSYYFYFKVLICRIFF